MLLQSNVEEEYVILFPVLLDDESNSYQWFWMSSFQFNALLLTTDNDINE
jgi:hypothetical protein